MRMQSVGGIKSEKSEGSSAGCCRTHSMHTIQLYNIQVRHQMQQGPPVIVMNQIK